MTRPPLASHRDGDDPRLAEAGDSLYELIGSALDPRLRSQRPLSASAARQVVARALGISTRELTSLDAAGLERAVERLRALVQECRRMESAAITDELTGALRRGAGLAALEREIARSRRSRSGVVIAFIDVDGLKEINDRSGHAAGDQLLRDVVASIRDRVRSYDLVLRYGGDEFVCALIDVSEEQAERTMSEIQAHFSARTQGHSFSVGFATCGGGDTAESVVQRADAALYATRRLLR